MWDRRAEYIENHDGDTIRMNLDQGFGDVKLVDIRLLGVFAPELSEEGGQECKSFVELWFDQQLSTRRWNFVVTTTRMRRTDKEQTTLSRYVATVTSLDGTENLNLEVIDFIKRNGYSGGTGS